MWSVKQPASFQRNPLHSSVTTDKCHTARRSHTPWTLSWYQLYFSAASVSNESLKNLQQFDYYIHLEMLLYQVRNNLISHVVSAVCLRLDLRLRFWVSNCGGSAWWRRHTDVLQLFQCSLSDNLVQTGLQKKAPVYLPNLQCSWTCCILWWISKWKIWNKLQHLNCLSQTPTSGFIGLWVVFLWILHQQKPDYHGGNIFRSSR